MTYHCEGSTRLAPEMMPAEAIMLAQDEPGQAACVWSTWTP